MKFSSMIITFLIMISFSITILIISNCEGILNKDPKFKIGDCLQYTGKKIEAWQKVKTWTYMVLDVGKNHYRFSYWDNEKLHGLEVDGLFGHEFYFIDKYYRKVDCKL